MAESTNPATPASLLTATKGGGILHNIPPKKNTLPTDGPGKSPFTYITPGHNTYFSYETPLRTDDEITLRQMSDYIYSDNPPLSGQFNNATLPQAPPLQVTVAGVVVPVGSFTKIHPAEKSVLHTSGKPTKLVKRVGGPSPTSDTPFHPGVAAPPPIHRVRPTSNTLRTFHNNNNRAPSFLQQGSANGSGNMRGNAHADTTASRWATIKKGAAG